ncbi:uncharacterized protein EDB93DRAFT_1256070 [Suillus bovinus]|uniref:uncharacterized protein n=1 Tax=Suillus bovinus TaxID=48563 RepID=UPI001B861A00|nr:uncharacterized protein EDB93DRAFT_1256070 [Suillus bovinus]KAG2129867.1 hypothetical protein EDB93DRAFT_1256070 [Suillus bovinus]
MAKSKTGPPYTGRNSEYVVVTTPWGMNRVPKSRDRKDFDRLAAWVQLILQDKDIGAKVECILSMGTRDEVIVQLPKGTDIQPLLGEHKLAIISKKWDGNPNDDRASCFFEYNFRNNGEPSNHNWAENFPGHDPGPAPPVKSPYPEPDWAEPSRSIRSLVLPIPPRPPLPTPEAELAPIPIPTTIPIPVSEEATHLPPNTTHTTPANITSAFKPYEPPTQHPAHGMFINHENQSRNSSADRQSNQPIAPEGEHVPVTKYMKKLDPYQEDEDALAILRTPPRDFQSKSKHVKLEHVKTEVSDTGFDTKYQPPQELIDAVNALLQKQSKEQKIAVCERSSMTDETLPGPSTSSRSPAELMDADDNQILEHNLDIKPFTKNNPKRLQDSGQKPQSRPCEINGRQSKTSEDEQKPVLNLPRAF